MAPEDKAPPAVGTVDGTGACSVAIRRNRVCFLRSLELGLLTRTRNHGAKGLPDMSTR